VANPPTGAIFWGEDEYLLRLAALAFLDGHEARATEVDARAWQGGETSDLSTPSLWGERRALLVSGCQGLPEAGVRELRAYLQAPSPDALCVLTLVSKARSAPPLAKAVQQAGGLSKQVALKRQDLPTWVLERARVRQVTLTPAGATALVGVLGETTAVLDQSVAQLGTAYSGREIGPDEVRTQFQGLGESRVWDLCDQAFSHQLGPALRTLRALLVAGEDPLMILGSIASRLRDLIRVASLPPRMSSSEAAAAANLRFDWQVRRYRDQARRTGLEELIRLHALVVDSDRALKGGWSADVLLPSLVAVMAGDETAALDLPVRVSR
jgi:DNA polymerase-3 subunit delta